MKPPLLLVSGLLGELTLIELIENNLYPDILTPPKNSLRRRDTGKIHSYSTYFKILSLEHEESKKFLLSNEINNYSFILTVDYPKMLFIDLLLPIPIYHAHPSLLPKYRGYSAISNQIINGVAISGLSIYIDNGITDAGDIVYQKKITIDHHDIPALFMEKVAKEIVFAFTNILLTIDIKPIPQDNNNASYTKRIKNRDHIIDFNQSAIYIYNFIRAFGYPYSNAYFYSRDIKYYIVSSYIEKWYGSYGNVGEVIAITQNGYEIAVGDGSIILKEVLTDNNISIAELDSIFNIGDIL